MTCNAIQLWVLYPRGHRYHCLGFKTKHAISSARTRMVDQLLCTGLGDIGQDLDPVRRLTGTLFTLLSHLTWTRVEWHAESDCFTLAAPVVFRFHVSFQQGISFSVVNLSPCPLLFSHSISQPYRRLGAPVKPALRCRSCRYLVLLKKVNPGPRPQAERRQESLSCDTHVDSNYFQLLKSQDWINPHTKLRSYTLHHTANKLSLASRMLRSTLPCRIWNSLKRNPSVDQTG